MIETVEMLLNIAFTKVVTMNFAKRRCKARLIRSKEVACEEVCETACVVPVRDPPTPRSYV
jgi:hypothetical protein